MKKRLFLLPLLGGLVLSGCTFTLFGKTIKLFEKDEKKETGGDEGGDEIGADDIVIDFASNVVSVDSYVDLDAEMSFEYEGITYSGIGCYDATGYFMMKNKKTENNQAVYGTKLAYFCNSTPFAKPVKEAIVTLNSGDKISTNTTYRINILSSFAEEAVTSGGQTGKGSKTSNVEVKTTSSAKDGYYVAVSTNLTGTSRYNGQITKLVIKF